MRKYGVALVGIVIMLVILNVMTNNQDGIPVTENSDAATWNDVKAFQYNYTPGLKRAETLGLAKELNIEIDVPQSGLTITLDEIWYNRNGGHLFYHVNIENPVELSFVVTSPDLEQPSNNFAHTGNLANGEGIVYNGDFHSRVSFGSMWDENGQPFSNIDKITLEQFSVSINDEKIGVEPVTFVLNYDESKEIVERIELDREIQVNDHMMFLDYIELGTVENKLAVEFRPNSQNTYLSSIRGDIKTNFGESFHIDGTSSVVRKDNKQVIYFNPFHDAPDEIDISLDAVKLVGDDSFSHELSLEPYKKDMSRLTEERGHIVKDVEHFIVEKRFTAITLDRLLYQPGGLMLDYTFHQEESEDVTERLIASSLVVRPDESDREQLDDYILGMVLEVKNEKGEQATIGGWYEDSDHRWGFDLDYSYLLDSEKLTITVENLLYEIKGDWHFTVKK